MHAALGFFRVLVRVLYFWLESVIMFFVPVSLKAKDVTGQLVLITGTGSGLGRHLALKFAERGANLVLWDLNTKGNEETAEMVKGIGQNVFTYTVDVTDKEAVFACAKQVKQDGGEVDILVNNAGIVAGKKILDLAPDFIEKVFQVNTLAHFWTIKAFLPDMIKRRQGHLVSVASLGGIEGISQLTDYCASKFAAIGLMESLELELQADGIEHVYCTTICPFFINTGMFNGVNCGKFFSLLNSEMVADEAMAAILCNKGCAFITRPFYFIYLLKPLVPKKVRLELHRALGSLESMDNFKGQNGLAKGA